MITKQDYIPMQTLKHWGLQEVQTDLFHKDAVSYTVDLTIDENTKIYVCTCDSDGNRIYFNKNLVQIWAIRPDSYARMFMSAAMLESKDFLKEIVPYNLRREFARLPKRQL